MNYDPHHPFKKSFLFSSQMSGWLHCFLVEWKTKNNTVILCGPTNNMLVYCVSAQRREAGTKSGRKPKKKKSQQYPDLNGSDVLIASPLHVFSLANIIAEL